jgi:hypothetical protein
MLARKSLFARVAASARRWVSRSSSTRVTSCSALRRCVSCAASRSLVCLDPIVVAQDDRARQRGGPTPQVGLLPPRFEDPRAKKQHVRDRAVRRPPLRRLGRVARSVFVGHDHVQARRHRAKPEDAEQPHPATRGRPNRRLQTPVNGHGSTRGSHGWAMTEAEVRIVA